MTLSHCPRCSSRWIVILRPEEYRPGYHAFCTNCSLYGPEAESVEEAAKAWNEKGLGLARHGKAWRGWAGRGWAWRGKVSF